MTVTGPGVWHHAEVQPAQRGADPDIFAALPGPAALLELQLEVRLELPWGSDLVAEILGFCNHCEDPAVFWEPVLQCSAVLLYCVWSFCTGHLKVLQDFIKA